MPGVGTEPSQPHGTRCRVGVGWALHYTPSVCSSDMTEHLWVPRQALSEAPSFVSKELCCETERAPPAVHGKPCKCKSPLLCSVFHCWVLSHSSVTASRGISSANACFQLLIAFSKHRFIRLQGLLLEESFGMVGDVSCSAFVFE
ncbi:unnamed protein product [Eretmochelys imbricata]